MVTELTGTVPVSWQITDLRGKVVMERDFGQRSGNFAQDVNLDEAEGIYFLRFKAGNQIWTEKIIVE